MIVIEFSIINNITNSIDISSYKVIHNGSAEFRRYKHSIFGPMKFFPEIPRLIKRSANARSLVTTHLMRLIKLARYPD